MKAYNLDHVGIAVRDLDSALAGYRTRYGIEVLHREVVTDQGVEEAMLALGGSYVQLITPVGPEGPVARFLDKRGEGLHHVAFAVLDLEVALAHLKITQIDMRSAYALNISDLLPEREGSPKMTFRSRIITQISSSIAEVVTCLCPV